MKDLVRAHIERSINAKQQVKEQCLEDIVQAASLLGAAYRNKKKLLCCGNGGSAGDAQHIATEFIIRYTGAHERPSLAALSLAADSSALTAGANDFGFDQVFARQIQGLGSEDDVLLAITTSGNSPNIIAALQAARSQKMTNLLLTGESGGVILAEHPQLVDVSIRVPAQETARIQECHIMIGQIICAIVEKELYNLG